MKEINLELYKTIYLIRKAETEIQRLYPDDEMKTPMHMSMGEESLVAGVVHALDPDDQVLGTYRSHALYLAKAKDTKSFFAEMFGKTEGCARGKAGSMHLSAADSGLLCCSAIVASNIPVAMGAAYANKYLNNNRIVAVFFGDGAMDEGVFWETVNFSGLHRLPILFVCEDNGFAVHTPRHQRQSYQSDGDLFGAFGIQTFEKKTTNPEHIYHTAKMALAHIHEKKQPCFLRLHYYRYLEHVGINEDFNSGYRSRDHFLEWLQHDPVRMQRERLLAIGIPLEKVESIERDIDQQIADSISFAKESTFPEPRELYEGVLSCA